MKKIFKKLVATVLVLAVLALCLVGCSGGGNKAMKLEGESLSVNMIQLFLSRMKGTLASSYAYGESALADSFWDTVVSADGTTYNDLYTSEVIQDAKTYLAALYAFEEEGLELPKATIDEIDEEIDRMIEDDADGSKNTFNSMLKAYGVNHKMLREAYIMEAKIAMLNDHLFSSLDNSLIEEYYQNNYVRFKQVFIYTYDLVYYTDENGDEIYYDTTDSKRISYDENAIVKKDSDGKTVKDANDDVVYVTEDGKIAYDKQNGKRSPVLDENGYQQKREYTKAELIEASDRAQLILEECEEKNYTLFDRLVDDYGEDEGMVQYPNGYYMTESSEYDVKEVLQSVFEMKPGEVKRIDSDYGIHIVMKYELDEGAYDNKENADFFVNNTTGKYVFEQELKNELLAKYLEKYMNMIVIDEKALEGVDIKSVGVNFYY
ncbi:MAG: hypothetical protein E7679_05285 [Ruminococcaceae bacterium]|nr:hypothetical protein [Oscillospiraceae bacterium]